MTLTITTWNVNSVRLRLPLMAGLVALAKPDVLCLQETKVVDAGFPLAPFAELGFPHAALNGFKGYNGVAILSRLPLHDIDRPVWCGREDGRHVVARIAGGIEIHNLYVPAGGDEPDPAANPKFAHKLRFLSELADWFGARRAPHNRVVVAGDLNIAPLETDVWSHRELLSVVSHTPAEVAAPTTSSTRCATSSRRRSGSTAGGATAPATGRLRTADAASTTCGSRPRCAGGSPRPAFTRRSGVGARPRTTLRSR
jgi:exodeoxyribonuclease-3